MKIKFYFIITLALSVTVPHFVFGQLVVKNSDTEEILSVANNGDVKINNFIGEGTRNVVADPAGILRIGGASSPIIFRAYQTNTITIPSNGIQIIYDTEEFDTADAYDPVTSIYQPSTPGYYLVIASVSVHSQDGSSVDILVRKNGGGYAQGVENSMRRNWAQNCVYTVTTFVYLDGDDYIDIFVGNNTGANLPTRSESSVTSYFSAARLF